MPILICQQCGRMFEVKLEGGKENGKAYTAPGNS